MSTRLVQLLIILVPCLLLGVVVVDRVDVGGVYHVTWEAGEPSPFIHGLRPSGRVAEMRDEEDAFLRLDGDPVYLSVTPPGDYETANVELAFRSNGQPLIELGATVDSSAGQIDLRPLFHEAIDASDWSGERRGDTVFLQREERYDGFLSFLEHPPELSEIATYQYSLPERDFTPPSWTRGPAVYQNDVSLRGYNEFVTATDGRALDLEVLYMDMNRSPGADSVSLRVFQNGELVAQKEMEDDGVERDTQASLGRKTISLRAEGLQSGLLKVELHGNNDIYWREIRSSLPRMTYLSNVFVGDEVGYLDGARSVDLWTDAQHVTLFTRHAEAVQTVRVGGQNVDVAIPHEHYHVEIDEPGLTKITVPKGDMLIVTDGRIAFNRQAFFNPFPVRLTDRTDLDALGVNYIVADYPERHEEDGWTQAGSTFSLGPLERESGEERDEVEDSYRFVLSLPNVEERGATVDVKRVDIFFMRPRRSLGDILRAFKNRF